MASVALIAPARADSLSSGAAPDAAGEVWRRCASVRLALHRHVRTSVHHYRGQPWVVVENTASMRSHRFTEAAWQIATMFDGERSVSEVLAFASAQLGKAAPDRAGLLMLMRVLQQAELLNVGSDVPASFLTGRLDAREQATRRARWRSPLGIRIPLLDPDRWLSRVAARCAPVLRRRLLLPWLALVAAGGVAAVANWPGLLAYWAVHAGQPGLWLTMLLVYPLMKALHEIGHALVVKRYGGDVHEMGIMLIVFLPLPYVDASAANGFAGKRERISVSAAGVAVEMALASVAMLAWWLFPDGLLGTVAFCIAVVGSVSTVAFNANPLLRFDGYYVLADALEIPGLYTRANTYLRYLAQTYLFGLQDVRSPVTAPGERAWFVAYGLAALGYRLTLVTVIALFVAGKAFVAGVVVALWFGYVQFVQPAADFLSFMTSSPRLRGHRLRAATVLGVLAGLTLVLLLMPLPSATSAIGIVRVPEQAAIRAGVDGFVRAMPARDGDEVAAGQPLLVLDNQALAAERAVLTARRAELRTRMSKALLLDRVDVALARSELATAEAKLAQVEDDLARLTLTSEAPGYYSVLERGLLGRYVRKGETIGYVTRGEAASARVVVPQTEVDRVAADTRRVSVRLAGAPGETQEARISDLAPAGSEQLPSSVLGSSGGGAIAVDGRDAAGTRALAPVFSVDLELPRRDGGYPYGARVYVRFEHAPEPMAPRIARRIRREFLTRFPS